MNAEQLKNHIDCEIDFTTFLYDLFPVKIQDSFDFEKALDTAVSNLKEVQTSQDFKKFEKILAKTINKLFPEVEHYAIPPIDENPEYVERINFLMLLKDHVNAPISYVQKLFTTLMTSFIKDNLTNAVVEFYTFTNTLPLVGQVFCLYKYERVIQDVFKEYKQLHNIVPGSMYYLKECIYEEVSCFNNAAARSHGQLNLRFGRYNTGDIY